MFVSMFLSHDVQLYRLICFKVLGYYKKFAECKWIIWYFTIIYL